MSYTAKKVEDRTVLNNETKINRLQLCFLVDKENNYMFSNSKKMKKHCETAVGNKANLLSIMHFLLPKPTKTKNSRR